MAPIFIKTQSRTHHIAVWSENIGNAHKGNPVLVPKRGNTDEEQNRRAARVFAIAENILPPYSGADQGAGEWLFQSTETGAKR